MSVSTDKDLECPICRKAGRAERVTVQKSGAWYCTWLDGNAEHRRAIIAARPELAPEAAAQNGNGTCGPFSVENGLSELGAESEESKAAPALMARDAIDLVNDTGLIEPPILVAGMLHKGSTLLLGASSKSFKSWSLIDLAVSVASGSPWWNLPCVKGRVLYADFELTPFFWRKRAMEIAESRGFTLAGIRVMNCRGHDAGAALLAIEAEAKGKPFDLIVLDPLYSFLAGRDENSAGDVGMVLRRLAMLAESTGAALAISHHFSKGNQAAKEAIDRFSGSGVFARFPDALLTMTRHEEDGAFTIDATIRNFAPMNPFVLRWQHPLMVRDGSLNPADVKKPPGSFQIKFTLDQVLKVMGSKMMTAREVELACYDAHKMSEASVKRLLKKGREEGKVIQPSAGLWQRLTESRP